jgi:hypothetical protein
MQNLWLLIELQLNGDSTGIMLLFGLDCFRYLTWSMTVTFACVFSGRCTSPGYLSLFDKRVAVRAIGRLSNSITTRSRKYWGEVDRCCAFCVDIAVRCIITDWR